MEISGKICKSKKDRFWLAGVSFLDLLVQAETKKEIPEMVKDAVELLVDDPNFSVDVYVTGEDLFLSANDVKKLVALMLKRLRLKNELKLEDVAEALNAKSINEYAQYEQAKHLPSIEKLQQFLDAIDPERQRQPIWL